MQELKTDIFSLDFTAPSVICIPTNGFIKSDGTNAMGAGIAKLAAEKYPALPKIIGNNLKENGNYVILLKDPWNGLAGYCSFPTKSMWWYKSSLPLIERSSKQLATLIFCCPANWQWYLPRPGCGMGQLNWEKEVKPIVTKILGDVKNLTIVYKE